MTVTQSKSIISKLWDEMDTVVAQVVPLMPQIKAATARSAETNMAEADDPVHLSHRLEVMTLTAEKNKLGGIGRGLAIALHMMTQPHFAEVGDVVKHAQARYKAAQSGETIATPGMSDESWPPEPAATPTPSEPAPAAVETPEFSSGPAVAEAEPKKAARGATKNTTAVPSSAAVSGATSSTTGISPASPVKAPAPKATPAPTPDEIIAQDEARGRGTGVEDAVAASKSKAAAARQAQADLEDKANGKMTEGLSTGDDDESPKSIAAMLEDLENM